ncbi:iron-containing redox enzyme family protein [Myxococcaceae bacterium JPH2]|nr:iron-containing redox enzyme family protein [Myxococcaceae bacterium JPH2]
MLCSEELSKQRFLDSQIEFAAMAHFFNRPMARRIANIPDAKPRVALVENLWEEHGKGIMEKVHGQTLLTLMDRLGGDSSKIDLQGPTPTARIFNEALRSVSSFEDCRFAASVFADISEPVCKAIVTQGWLKADQITHDSQLKEMDIQHADDFLQTVNTDWNTPSLQPLIRDGLRFGCQLFANADWGFYSSMIR